MTDSLTSSVVRRVTVWVLDAPLRHLNRKYGVLPSYPKLKRWFMNPFTMKIDVYEHTHIEHRAFPYRLRVQSGRSLQEQVDSGYARGHGETYHLTEPIVIRGNGTALRDLNLRGHGNLTAIEVDPDNSGASEGSDHCASEGSDRG